MILFVLLSCVAYAVNTACAHYPNPGKATSQKFAWCPDSDFCNPVDSNAHSTHVKLCERKWLFIFATGRSGSTTLLESLNAVNGIRLSGENRGVLTAAKEIMSDIRQLNPDMNHIGAFSHNKFNSDHVLYRLQQIFLDINPPVQLSANTTALDNPAVGGSHSTDLSTIVGFKDIRYNSRDYVQFMKVLFPCSRFIFNIRDNIGQQIASMSRLPGFVKQNISKEPVLRETNTMMRRNVHLFPKTSLLVRLEDFSIDKFSSILNWLGFSNCRFTRISHSNKASSYRADVSAKVEGNCSINVNKIITIPT